MSNRFSFIKPDFKIGYNCEKMAISTFLEVQKRLSYALSYTNFDFIYNSDHFTMRENTKASELLLSKNNHLIMEENVQWGYHKAYNDYHKSLIKDYGLFKPKTYSIVDKSYIDLTELKEDYLDNGIPISIFIDHYYVYDEYKKLTSDIVQYHSESHAVAILDLDIKNNRCIVVDKLFSFLGEVKLEHLISSFMSDYVKDFRYSFLEIEKDEYQTENERIRKYLKKNIEDTLKNEVTIGDVKYYKNINALKMFIDDFDEVVLKLVDDHGLYAPQFTNNLLQPIIHQRRSFKNLMKYISDNIEKEELKNIYLSLEEIQNNWLKIMLLCNKCFLTGNSLDHYTTRILKVLKKIYEQEFRVYDRLSLVVDDL